MPHWTSGLGRHANMSTHDDTFDADMGILPTLPLRTLVPFPKMIFTVFVGPKNQGQSLESLVMHSKYLFLVAQKHDVVNPKKQDLYRIGVIARIIQAINLPDGSVKILVEGLDIARATYRESKDVDFFMANTEIISDDHQLDHDTLMPLARALHKEIDHYQSVSQEKHTDVLDKIRLTDDIESYVYLLCGELNINIHTKQKWLEATSFDKKIRMIIDAVQQEIHWANEENQIRNNVRQKITKEQEDYFIRTKIDELKNRLSPQAKGIDETQDYTDKLKAMKLPQALQDKIALEIDKLKMMPPMSAESGVVRGYLDTIFALPWHKKTKINKDLSKAKTLLEQGHYGIKEVKDHIIEHIAVQMRVPKTKGSIICLVGPPGVGKTSLAQSIAKAMGRQFVRIALGGVRDEAEIRGHRKTYVGAMPGRFIKALKTAGVNNPLILLDEIDKMGMDFRGDPASALLEVLDPEQNHTFVDHYLELEFDLSGVFFITTANSLDIPHALADRMEIINIAGYTESEKNHIATQFLLPKAIKNTGLKPDELSLSSAVILQIIRFYTQEAGVRELERKLLRICRKVVKAKLESQPTNKVIIRRNMLTKYLGVQIYDYGKVNTQNAVGIVRGLAWTSVGGDLLTIEACLVPGSGKTIYTGRLGDVMQESIKAALTIIKSRSEVLDIATDAFEKHDIHIHVPQGATPKDGPSAGIAMTVALASIFTNIDVDASVAMTGEITLRGDILPIGGLKEKLLAASRGGIKTVIIPHDNAKNLEEISKDITSGLVIKPMKWIDEAFGIALTSMPGSKSKSVSSRRKGLGSKKKLNINS